MDRFDAMLHRLGDWCADHTTATVGIIGFAFGLVLGAMLAL